MNNIKYIPPQFVLHQILQFYLNFQQILLKLLKINLHLSTKKSVMLS